MTLKQLQAQRGFPTDKDDAAHTFEGRSYLDIYDEIFRPIRHRVGNVLEMGVLAGGSLRLWRAFFGASSKIVGIDIDPGRKINLGEGIEVETGSQADSTFMHEVEATHGPFKVIIDDGSHVVDHMLASFVFLWRGLLPGGIYVIEDLGCTYRNAELFWPGMRHNPELPANSRSRMDMFLLDLVREMDHLRGEVRKIEIHPMIVAIHKV